jgi:hypothetical protein
MIHYRTRRLLAWLGVLMLTGSALADPGTIGGGGLLRTAPISAPVTGGS